MEKKLFNEDIKNCITIMELYNNCCDTIPVNYITIYIFMQHMTHIYSVHFSKK